MNRLYYAVIGLLFISQAAPCAEYKVDPDHSNISFTIKHMFSNVSGEFREYEGSFNFDDKKGTADNLKFTVQTQSIDTHHEKRDKHLRGADFFDVDNHPTATFVSKKISKVSGRKYKVMGDLTMHGKTKPIAFEAEFMGEGKDPWGNVRAAFNTVLKLKRKDFGITWNQTLDSGGLLLGETVDLKIQLEALKQGGAEESVEKKAKKS